MYKSITSISMVGMKVCVIFSDNEVKNLRILKEQTGITHTSDLLRFLVKKAVGNTPK